MSEQNDFDSKLLARFEQEQPRVPADSFVAATMQKVRAEGRRREFMRVGWRVAGLAALVMASPWLIKGVERLNAALDSSFSLALGQAGSWILGALALLAALVMRARRR